MRTPVTWYVESMTPEQFLLGMLELGTPVELSVVGAFEPADTKGRGSRRDKDLPLHRDGEYSAKLAEAQGGTYVEAKDVDFVGLYCLRGGDEPCYTTIDDGSGRVSEVNLQQGQALVFNNRAILHGRRGPVGRRILLRMWVSKKKAVLDEPHDRSK